MAFAAPDYTDKSIITQLNPREFGLEIVLPTGGNRMSCGIAGRYRLLLSAANYEVISTILITSAVQGRQVQVYTNSCDQDGVSIMVAAMVGI